MAAPGKDEGDLIATEEWKDAARMVSRHVQRVAALPIHVDDGSLDVVVRHACKESFLIHVRVLTEFFGGGDPRSMHCSEFLEKWSPPRDSEAGQGLVRLRRDRSDISQWIAHIDWVRVEPVEEQYGLTAYRQMRRDILALFRAFTAEAVERGHPQAVIFHAALLAAQQEAERDTEA
ncbi:MAG: hypothetical protein ACRDYU_01490 [Actinomycetes bacterium]